MTPKAKTESSSKAQAGDEFHASLMRAQNGDWVRCCPSCFSTNIVPFRVSGATWIVGIVDQGSWVCRKCGYHGAAIEANRSDLTELLRHRRVSRSPKEKKASYLDNRKHWRRDTGL